MFRYWLCVLIIAIFGCGLAYGQLSCGFIVDLSSPNIDSLYPGHLDTVSSPVTFGATVSDDGAGVWFNYSQSMTEWDTSIVGCDIPVATYITWAVNSFSPADFIDTTYGFVQEMKPFNSGDSIKVCMHVIDSIHNLGCSCCPNDVETCWVFYIFACDTFELTKSCPDPCEVITSCDDQSVTWYIDPVSTAGAGPDTANINVFVSVNGTPYTGTIGTLPWAEYYGDPDDMVFPDSIVISPPAGIWNHHDSVVVIIYKDDCPIVLADSCWFLVDLLPPLLTTFFPNDGDTITSAAVNISGTLADNFAGVESTWVDVQIHSDSIGIPFDTTYEGLTDAFNLGRAYTDGDSVYVCVHSIDAVDIQPGCLCPPNLLDTCWSFIILIGAVDANVVVPYDSTGDLRYISTCEDQYIIWNLIYDDGIGLDWASLQVSIQVSGGAIDYYDMTYSQLDTITDGHTLVFTPSPMWSDGDSVYFCINHIEIMTGIYADNIACGWILIDLEPPVLTIVGGPVDFDTIMVADTTGTVVAFDAVCDSVPIDSIVITTTLSGLDTIFYGDSYDIGGFNNHDDVNICAYASDHCEDYTCLDTSGVLCWTYHVLLGEVDAVLIEPLDLNGDGYIISTCDTQTIIWTIDYDTLIGLDWDRLMVTVDGVAYHWSDPQLDTADAFTLVFTPNPLWIDGDSIPFVIDTLADLSGGYSVDIGGGWVIMDYAPPYRTVEIPLDGTTIFSSSITIDASFLDERCLDSLDLVDSCWATTSVSGLTFEGTDFPLNPTGMVDGDSVAVCAIVSDGCQDYCSDNVDTICWFFRVLMGEPYGEFMTPPDTNGDGWRVTTCDDGGFIIYVYDSHGMDTTYFHLIVDGTEYHHGDIETSVDYVGDSTVMEIFFDPGLSLASGTVVHVILDSAFNVIGDPLVGPVIDSFLIDTEPPTFTYSGPTGIYTGVSAACTVLANDDICGGDISLDSLVITTDISGLYWLITTGDWDTVITGLMNGDVVSICAYAHDICSDTCGPNFGDSCWTFDVETGITAVITEPIDLNADGDTISACVNQGIYWFISTDVGIDSTSIAATVCGSTYVWGNTELFFHGDTLVWTPPLGFWSDDDFCAFCLDACDIAAECLDPSVCGDVLIDLEGPIFSGESPTDGTTIFVSDTSIIVTALDEICAATGTVPDSITVSTSVSGISISDAGTLGIDITGLVDGDVVTVCAYAHDDCADYCGPNESFYCWDFSVALGALRPLVLEPIDLNSDGCIESSCSCQTIQWRIFSQHGIDTTTLQITIDGITYSFGPEFDLILDPGIPADTTWLLTFYPSTAGTCWSENCYVVDYIINFLEDTTHTDTLIDAAGGSFTVITDVPTVYFDPMPTLPDTCLDTVVVDVYYDFTCACTITEWLQITFNGVLVETWDSMGTVSWPVISGDTVCIAAGGELHVDYECDSLMFFYDGDPCYPILCDCEIVVAAGPDQYSCPAADVTLGCVSIFEVLTGVVEQGVNWYIAGVITPFSTDENPVVNPMASTTYIVEGWAECVAGDTVWDYDTVEVIITHEPVGTPVINNPADLEIIPEGTNPIEWSMPTGDTPIYFIVLRDGIQISPDSLTDTFYTYDILCEETIELIVIAYNSCFYALDDSCNPDDNDSGWVYAQYETSLVVTVTGETCGQPVAELTYPPDSTIIGCDDQQIIFHIWDNSGVALIPDSLRIQIEATVYERTETFIDYVVVAPDEGNVTVDPPSGTWNDDDTVYVAVVSIFNELGVELDTPAEMTFFTDFTAPFAEMTYPTPDSSIGARSPAVAINVTDNVCGVVEDDFVARVYNSIYNETLTYPDAALSWDGADLVISFSSLGIELADGESIYVDLHTCDCVETLYCGPNCDDYTWTFYYPYQPGCDRMPNPFTPNADAYNEYCQFTFPDMGVYAGTILIYDIHGVKIRTIEVDAGLSVDMLHQTARWDGANDDNEPVPMGLYIFVIEVEGEIVCDGTVTIAR